MTKVALTAEKLNHHPTFINTYGDVTIKLSTHEGEEPVTDKDHFLAAAIDNIYGD
jgi:4a-hydroxytetrahydrobiopterin dehydratase